jgi:uncharacterized membrane protein
MNSKQIGIAIIILTVLLAVSLFWFKTQNDDIIAQLMKESNGSCFTEEGVCLHQHSNAPSYIGIAVIFLALGLGLYLLFFNRNQQILEREKDQFLKVVKNEKAEKDKDAKFSAVLSALTEDEQKVLKAIKEQNGISQSTLVFRTDLSKAKISSVLTEFEKKGLVRKVKKGKINSVYLKNKY